MCLAWPKAGCRAKLSPFGPGLARPWVTAQQGLWLSWEQLKAGAAGSSHGFSAINFSDYHCLFTLTVISIRASLSISSTTNCFGSSPIDIYATFFFSIKFLLPLSHWGLEWYANHSHGGWWWWLRDGHWFRLAWVLVLHHKTCTFSAVANIYFLCQKPWLGPSQAGAKPWVVALAWPISPESRSCLKPSQSHGFWAKLGQNITSYHCLQKSTDFRLMSIIYYRKGGYLQLLFML